MTTLTRDGALTGPFLESGQRRRRNPSVEIRDSDAAYDHMLAECDGTATRSAKVVVPDIRQGLLLRQVGVIGLAQHAGNVGRP